MYSIIHFNFRSQRARCKSLGLRKWWPAATYFLNVGIANNVGSLIIITSTFNSTVFRIQCLPLLLYQNSKKERSTTRFNNKKRETLTQVVVYPLTGSHAASPGMSFVWPWSMDFAFEWRTLSSVGHTCYVLIERRTRWLRCKGNRHRPMYYLSVLS